MVVLVMWRTLAALPGEHMQYSGWWARAGGVVALRFAHAALWLMLVLVM